jgi:FkbM family methyltransferase
MAKEVFGWFLPSEDTHFEQYLRNQVSKGLPAEYQPVHRERALTYCSNRRVAVDIGAHVGLWSRSLSDGFETVHSFEPIASFRELLARNAPKANAHPFALGEHESVVALTIPADNTGMAHIVAGSEGKDGGIAMRTLDSFDFPIVDFIKVDCEGYEYPALKGAVQTLSRCRPVIIVEQKPHGHFAEQWPYDAALHFLVKQCGYTARERVAGDWILVPSQA